MSEPASATVRSRVSPEEWSARVDLAACYRLVAHYHWDDLVFTHISAKVPGPEKHFLINPYGKLFDEITASSLVKIDLDGNVVMDSPYPVNPAGFIIHSAIHAARADAQCILHLHTPAGQAVSAQRHGLLPLTQTSMTLYGAVAYHDFEGVATDLGERERLVRDLGDKNVLILRNHGTLTVGESVSDAFMRMYFLERACEVQVLALRGGAEINRPPEGTPEKTAETAAFGLTTIGRMLAWPALLRRLDRLDPSYRD
jgi:ribulose-5-phosphate 4-epimerase/fuculose-1-phosphate aldolase